MPKHIVSIGDLVLDIIFPVTLPIQANLHQDPAERRLEPGGASNFLIAARHMGLTVTAAGAVGADPFGALILEALTAEGIDTRFVIATPGSTSTLVIALTDQGSGEHTFIGNYGQGPEIAYPPALDDAITSADALFLQGYTLVEQRVVPLAKRAIEHAHARHVPIYLDVGPFMAHVDPALIPWLIQHAQVVLMTEDEVPLVTNGQSGDQAYAALLQAGPEVLVIKQGAQGCTIITPTERAHIPGYAVEVVDTVGAGDCFDAAFIAGRLHALSWVHSAQLANAMGAAAVQRVGAGRNAPTCADVLALLRAHNSEVNYPCS